MDVRQAFLMCALLNAGSPAYAGDPYINMAPMIRDAYALELGIPQNELMALTLKAGRALVANDRDQQKAGLLRRSSFTVQPHKSLSEMCGDYEIIDAEEFYERGIFKTENWQNVRTLVSVFPSNEDSRRNRPTIDMFVAYVSDSGEIAPIERQSGLFSDDLLKKLFLVRGRGYDELWNSLVQADWRMTVTHHNCGNNIYIHRVFGE